MHITKIVLLPIIWCLIADIAILRRKGRIRKKKNRYLRNEKTIQTFLFSDGFQRKQDRCKVFPFNQTVFKRGCIPVIVPNNLCYGQCASFYIPARNPFEDNSNRTALFQDCRQCIPLLYRMIRIPMFCPDRKRKYRTKKVLLIESCRCKTRKCIINKR